jgi:hypothetical protein
VKAPKTFNIQRSTSREEERQQAGQQKSGIRRAKEGEFLTIFTNRNQLNFRSGSPKLNLGSFFDGDLNEN